VRWPFSGNRPDARPNSHSSSPGRTATISIREAASISSSRPACQQLLGTVAAIPETAAYGVALGAKCGLVLELHCANLLNRWALAVITSPIRRRFRDGRPAAGARAAADRRVIAGHDDWVRTSINGSPQPV
jgi:hypothetical protein